MSTPDGWFWVYLCDDWNRGWILVKAVEDEE